MITRIVRMEFMPDKVDAFLSLFRNTEDRIRNFPGVLSLELFRDFGAENVFFTISKWKDKKDLEAYRDSELFKEVWGKTKVMFAEKAVAYSMVKAS